MAESWSLSICGKSQHVGIFFFFFILYKASRHQIHTFQSSLHREAGILTLIQSDEPEKLSTDPTLLSNIATNLKEKKRERTNEKKNITFLNCLDTWFPDSAGHQAEVHTYPFCPTVTSLICPSLQFKCPICHLNKR